MLFLAVSFRSLGKKRHNKKAPLFVAPEGVDSTSCSHSKYFKTVGHFIALAHNHPYRLNYSHFIFCLGGSKSPPSAFYHLIFFDFSHKKSADEDRHSLFYSNLNTSTSFFCAPLGSISSSRISSIYSFHFSITGLFACTFAANSTPFLHS